MFGRRALFFAAPATALALLIGVPTAQPEGPPKRKDTRQVMFVGNNWDGTADIFDAATFKRLGRINTIPDKEQRMAEIFANPVRAGFFLAIREQVGEGHDQFTDDMFTSHDGRFVYVSRPSFADVVGISLASGKIVWRFPMEGQRSDHMAISPDGKKLLVSDSTANKVHELDAATGKKTGEFPSGDSPHESNYIKDGSLILHASIGRVYTPTDRSEIELVRDTSKGARYFQVVDAKTLKVLERFDMGDKLAEAGRPDMESAVRPMAVAPDERYVYLQISFFHGYVEYDLEQDKVTRIIDLPVSDKAKDIPREQYLLDSAHHGLAIAEAGTKLCVAGTMSDYAAIVSRQSSQAKIFPGIDKPYWSTNSPDGKRCWVSASGSDKVVVLDYATERTVATMPVGDHPQRVRAGALNRALVGDLPKVGDRWAPRIRVRGMPRSCRSRDFSVRVRIGERTRLRGARVSLGARSLKQTRRRHFRVRIPARQLRPGRHRLRIRATDAAGNRARRALPFKRCRG